MAWEPATRNRGGTALCLLFAAALVAATMPASSAASQPAGERELPLRIGAIEDVVVLEPADPRTPELRAQAPAASEGLFSGELAEHGWPVRLVVTEEWSLGLVSAPTAPVWVELAEDGLVPVEPEVVAEASGPVDREQRAPAQAPQPPKAQTASPEDGTLQIALEGDWEYYGRMIDAWDEYQLEIIHLVEAIFLHTTQVPFEVVEQRIQIGNDQPVDGNEICSSNDEKDVLDQFRNYREDEAPTVESERELAHLFTSKTFSGTSTIGCAAVRAIDTHRAYGVSQIRGPLAGGDALRDVFLVAHEIGHNFYGLHGRSMPTPGGTWELGSCATTTTIMNPCINTAKIPTFSTTGGTEVLPWDEHDVVEGGGNQPHMQAYGQSRT